ncbi:hypothetical protein NL387_27590, partial [Klebsiella pneumoniae]|nr:hypothetical protein [Klebsiella pneumoniae]
MNLISDSAMLAGVGVEHSSRDFTIQEVISSTFAHFSTRLKLLADSTVGKLCFKFKKHVLRFSVFCWK